MTQTNPVAAELFAFPIPGDFRQGDIYKNLLHLMLSESGYQVLRTFQGKQGRVNVSLHGVENPPTGGFKWEGKEQVRAEGQLGLGIVITHDCEIENADSREHRLVCLLRPFEALNDNDKLAIVENRHFGRLYLPSWADIGLFESYVDFRRITTLRSDALPDEDRIASMTDKGRQILQYALARYLTEMYRA